MNTEGITVALHYASTQASDLEADIADGLSQAQATSEVLDELENRVRQWPLETPIANKWNRALGSTCRACRDVCVGSGCGFFRSQLGRASC